MDSVSELNLDSNFESDWFHDSSSNSPPSLHLTDILSSIAPEVDTALDSATDGENYIDPLYSSASVGVKNSTLMLKAFVNRFHLNDVTCKALYRLVSALLPDDDKRPSSCSHIKSSKDRCENWVLDGYDNDSGACRVLRFGELLLKVVERNFSQLLEYSLKRADPSFISDLNNNCFSGFNLTDDSLTVDLIFSSDRVILVKSSSKHECWPVWLSLAQLPPASRMSQKNIVLSVLYVGSGKPDWNSWCLRYAKNSSVHII